MKNLSLLNRLALTVAGALALGACNRSEYAMLPKSSSAYLHSTTVAAQPHAAPATVAPAAPVAEAALPAATPAPANPTETAVVTTKAPQAAAPVATAPAEVPATVAAAPAAPAKLNLVQRLAVKKLTKKLEKLTANAPVLKKHDAAASTARIDDQLRQVIIIGAVGLIVEIIGAALGSVLIYVVGAIIIIVALVLLLLYLLDKL